MNPNWSHRDFIGLPVIPRRSSVAATRAADDGRRVDVGMDALAKVLSCPDSVGIVCTEDDDPAANLSGDELKRLAEPLRRARGKGR